MDKIRERMIDELTARPVIAAVRRGEDVRLAAESPVAVVFLLGGTIMTMPRWADELHAAGKLVFMHMDLCEGLGKDAAAVRWCAQNLALHGLISTRAQLLNAASEAGLLTIQRMFLMDSASLESGLRLMHANPPDLVELLPGLVPKAIRVVRSQLDIPVIAGGMITEAEEVTRALSAGALAVSTSERMLWRMGV